jgi:hypothetical protein
MVPEVTPLAVVSLQATPEVGLVTGLLGSAGGAFLTTLVVGAVLVAFAPDYTERTMAAVRAAPVGAFLYGLVCLLFVVLVTIVLAITIIGIILAIPFAILAAVIWAVGAAIAALAVADRFVSIEDGWTKPLLLAAGLNGALALTGIGGLVAFCLGAVGFGAVLRDRL